MPDTLSSTPPATASTTNGGDEDMKIDPARAAVLQQNLAGVLARIESAAGGGPVRLIAVSKLKPASDILALHRSTGHAHFGESYLPELQQKSVLLPSSIRWHFIGGLQSNKARKLAADVRGLWCVSSIDSAKKADGLEKGWRERKEGTDKAIKEERKGTADGQREEEKVKEEDGRLRVHVQVNTYGEDTKSGVNPGVDTIALCRHVVEKCPQLRLIGLMTIGAIERSDAAAEVTTHSDENLDYVVLRKARDEVAEALGVEKDSLELSMGMSRDFEAGIKSGSSEVRVGEGIFGKRPPKVEAVV